MLVIIYNRYESGDRLSPEHETAIRDKLLPYHPEYDKKVGCGIDYIKVCLLSFFFIFIKQGSNAFIFCASIMPPLKIS